MSTVQSRALAVLRSAKNSATSSARPGLEMLVLALAGKGHTSGGFGKVIKMIDDMVALLGKEQSDDDDKKAYCADQFDASDDKKKALERAIAGADSSIANA